MLLSWSNGELTPDLEAHANPENVVPSTSLSNGHAVAASRITKIDGYEVLVGEAQVMQIGKEIGAAVVHVLDSVGV